MNQFVVFRVNNNSSRYEEFSQQMKRLDSEENSLDFSFETENQFSECYVNGNQAKNQYPTRKNARYRFCRLGIISNENRNESNDNILYLGSNQMPRLFPVENSSPNIQEIHITVRTIANKVAKWKNHRYLNHFKATKTMLHPIFASSAIHKHSISAYCIPSVPIYK